MIAGYEPHRIAALGVRTRAALHELESIVSSDPEAADAIAALARMRRVLVDGLLPAVRSIEATDPLVRAIARPGLTGSLWSIDWLTSSISNAYRSMSDDELLLEFDRLEPDAPYDDEFRPDMDDPFWVRFEALAIESARRAAIDTTFADRLVEQTDDSFLIPMAVAFAPFDPQLVGRMLREVSRTPSAVVDLRSNYQARGAETLLSFLADHPGAALEALDETMLKELIDWPTLDSGSVSVFLDAAMAAPFDDPARLRAAYEVLQDLVVLADGPYESGFPPQYSPTLSRIVIQYVPFFMTSLKGRSDVHLKDFEFHDVQMRLGSYLDVVDLFGALIREPMSLDIVLAAIPALSIVGAADNGPLGIGPHDVAEYVDTIDKAARNEQVEELLREQRSERDAIMAIDIAFGALELVSKVVPPPTIGGTAIPLDQLRGGTTSLVEWAIRETDLGLESVQRVSYLLVVFGLGVAVLRSRTDRADTDSDRSDETDRSGSDRTDEIDAADAQNIATAEAIVERIEARLAEGASVIDVEGLIDDDFRRVMLELDHDGIMDMVDHGRGDEPRLIPSDDDVETNADLE